MALVGDQGAELVSLPAGANVYSNYETRQMLKNSSTGEGAGGGVNLTIHAPVSIGSVDADNVDAIAKKLTDGIKDGGVEVLRLAKVIYKTGYSKSDEAV
jgi:hypothetical protein